MVASGSSGAGLRSAPSLQLNSSGRRRRRRRRQEQQGQRRPAACCVPRHLQAALHCSAGCVGAVELLELLL